MKFFNWIWENGGPVGLSRKLKCSRYTIYAWLDTRATPNSKAMKRLVKMGNGKFGYDDIINETKRGSRK